MSEESEDIGLFQNQRVEGVSFILINNSLEGFSIIMRVDKDSVLMRNFFCCMEATNWRMNVAGILESPFLNMGPDI